MSIVATPMETIAPLTEQELRLTEEAIRQLAECIGVRGEKEPDRIIRAVHTFGNLSSEAVDAKVRSMSLKKDAGQL